MCFWYLCYVYSYNENTIRIKGLTVMPTIHSMGDVMWFQHMFIVGYLCYYDFHGHILTLTQNIVF